MKRTLLAGIAILAAGSALAQGGAALAQGGAALDRRVLEISEQLRCPTCQAISVRDSEVAFSRQIREKVRSLLEEGRSEEEIKAYFVERYGEWILRAPKKEGVGLILWGLPLAGIAAAGAWLFWKQRKNVAAYRANAGLQGFPETAITGAERERIDRDLKRFDRGF